MRNLCSLRPEVKIENDTLCIDDVFRIASPDLIDLLLLGRNVPLFYEGYRAGSAQLFGNLIHVYSPKGNLIIRKKCLMSMIQGDVLGIRAQVVPSGVMA